MVHHKVFKDGALYDTLGALTMPKVKSGISLESELINQIDAIVEASTDLGASRSELIEAILSAFLKANTNPTEKARTILIKHRKGLI
jgi:metal-responsive CopG/Arc/MetJ family transcriptional regulator